MKPPYVIWITGLSAAGKTTVGNALVNSLKEAGVNVEQLDGDRLRKLFPKTGFSKKDRDSHIHRVGYLAGLLERNGVTVVASLISPYKEARTFVRSQCKQFIEVYLSTPLEECEKRDPKGLYKKARKGEITNMTGLTAPYEEPENPELIVDTSLMPVNKCVDQLIDFLIVSKIIFSNSPNGNFRLGNT